MLSAIYLSLLLASITTLLLLILAVPLAYWLAYTQSKLKPLIMAITTLPLVLPPTVIGFYLLIAFNPNTFLGSFWLNLTGDNLNFSFSALVIGSLIYSLPFMTGPMQNTFENIGIKPIETAQSLAANKIDSFFSVLSPLAFKGYITACTLSFAHTIGEFGIVLMIGGNIPGKTQLISIQIYEFVETLDYASAHLLSSFLLIFTVMILWLVFKLNKNSNSLIPKIHRKNNG